MNKYETAVQQLEEQVSIASDNYEKCMSELVSNSHNLTYFEINTKTRHLANLRADLRTIIAQLDDIKRQLEYEQK